MTSTTTVSTTGCFRTSFRGAFFTGARLGLALATVRFAALATLRTLPRLAEFPLRSFARFCTFDRFLRLAIIVPLVLRNDTTVQVAARYQTRVITRFQLERDRLGAILPRSDWRLEDDPLTASSTNPAMPCEGTGTRYGLEDEGKAVGCVSPTALAFEESGLNTRSARVNSRSA
jgi:hypothetical protein